MTVTSNREPARLPRPGEITARAAPKVVGYGIRNAWRAWKEYRKAADLGGSSAQSVILMLIVVALTVVQFRFVEKKVQY